MSIFPKYAVTLPSGRMAIQESSSFGMSGGLARPVAPAATLWVKAAPGTDTLTRSEPDAFRKSRREVVFMCALP
jgi:hypothetical protein